MAGRSARSWEFLTRGYALTLFALTSPLFLGFAFAGDPGRGLVASVSAVSLTLVVRYLWDLSSRPWFWVTLAAVVAAHVYLVLLIPWPNMRWGPGLTPIVLVQILVVRGVFWLVERIAGFFQSDSPQTLGAIAVAERAEAEHAGNGQGGP